MTRRPMAALAFIWAAIILFWPLPSNKTSDREDLRMAAAGEGLYKASPSSAQFGILGFNFYETKEGKKSWYIRSNLAELHRNENYAFLQDVTAEF